MMSEMLYVIWLVLIIGIVWIVFCFYFILAFYFWSYMTYKDLLGAVIWCLWRVFWGQGSREETFSICFVIRRKCPGNQPLVWRQSLVSLRTTRLFPQMISANGLSCFTHLLQLQRPPEMLSGGTERIFGGDIQKQWETEEMRKLCSVCSYPSVHGNATGK